MNIMRITLFILAVLLSSCGGGGGSGLDVGVGGTGGGTPAPGGLVSGGLGVQTDPSASGVSVDVGVGGTGALMGDIQGIGSIILNDATFNTDNAIFFIEGTSGVQSDLRQGQQVLVVANFATATAIEVHYRSNAKGPVTSIISLDTDLGLAVLEVLGQTVVIDATTTLSNFNLADVMVNDLLEVSGTLDATGQILASFVEVKPSLAEYKLTGIVANLTNTTFSIGALTIDFSSANVISPQPIANGDAVEIESTPPGFTTPNSFTADSIEALPTLTVGGDAVMRLEGIIDRFASINDFDVQSTPITTDSNTLFVNGDASSLALNVKVQIEGTGEGSGLILASKITIQPTNAIRAEGNLETIDVVANRLSVLGVSFELRTLTRLEDKTSANVSPFTINDLGVGDEVEIRGYLDGTTVVASRLDREDPADRARLRGPVTDENASGGTVSILNVLVTGQTGITQYQDSDDNIISQTEFHNQIMPTDFVRATWDIFVDTTGIADELAVEN